MPFPPFLKSKLLTTLLLVTSLFGYLEWGGGHRSFLFQVEGEVLAKLISGPASVAHPLVLLPLLGQVLLLITIFQRRPNQLLTYVGMACLALLLLFIFVVGVLGGNAKITFSTLPFLVVAVLAIRHYRSSGR